MLPNRPDLDTVLRNVSKTFAMKATQQRQQAEHLRERLAGFQGELLASQYKPAIARCEAQAENWERRAAEANNGYFLFGKAERNDGELMREFTDVLSACQGQGRVVYESSVEVQRANQVAAGGPYPDDNRGGTPSGF